MTPQDVEELATQWTSAQRTVAAFVRSLVTDFHASEDVLQRVAVALVRKYDHYDRRRPFIAWALGMAKIEVLMYLRQAATDRLVFDDALVERIADSYEHIADDPSPVPQFVNECVEELDGRSRQAIDLRYGKDLPTAQIALEMQLSDGAVRMMLSRSRSLLRKCLELRITRWKESK